MARIKYYNQETGTWEYADSQYSVSTGSGGNVDLTGVVKSVNGVTPDENGNVEISVSGGSGGGMSSTASALLITILRNGVYNTNQSANITALENALKSSGGGSSGGSGDSGGTETPDEPENPEVTLSSISATYSGGDVPAGTSVLALSGIVVTAHYSDGSTATVTDYTLSGEIAEGENTVTVSYGGMTATFTVTGTVETSGSLTWSSGYFTTFGTIGSSTNGMYCEEYLPAVPGEAVYMYSSDPECPIANFFACFYDSEKNFISRSVKVLSVNNCPEYDGVIVAMGNAPENAAFFRACADYVGGYENSITVSAECPKPYLALEDTTWEAGYINDNGNFQTYSSGGRWATNKISVEPGATYRFGNSNPNCNLTAFYIGIYKTIVGGFISKVSTAEFIVPENANYVRLSAKTMSEADCATATLEKIS